MFAYAHSESFEVVFSLLFIYVYFSDDDHTRNRAKYILNINCLGSGGTSVSHTHSLYMR